MKILLIVFVSLMVLVPIVIAAFGDSKNAPKPRSDDWENCHGAGGGL